MALRRHRSTAPSLIEGAALAGRIVELSAGIVENLRTDGGPGCASFRDEHAEAVSASAARDLGLVENPAMLRHLEPRVRIREPDCGEAVLAARTGSAPGEDGG